jgi:acyl dehydratase
LNLSRAAFSSTAPGVPFRVPTCEWPVHGENRKEEIIPGLVWTAARFVKMVKPGDKVKFAAEKINDPITVTNIE